ncbi:hypothetical protein KKG45_01865, partial [bacterium]|nr:hypothetical protein [bacterium]
MRHGSVWLGLVIFLSSMVAAHGAADGSSRAIPVKRGPESARSPLEIQAGTTPRVTDPTLLSRRNRARSNAAAETGRRNAFPDADLLAGDAPASVPRALRPGDPPRNAALPRETWLDLRPQVGKSLSSPSSPRGGTRDAPWSTDRL